MKNVVGRGGGEGQGGGDLVYKRGVSRSSSTQSRNFEAVFCSSARFSCGAILASCVDKRVSCSYTRLVCGSTAWSSGLTIRPHDVACSECYV